MVKITPKPLPKCSQHNIHPTASFEAYIATISTPAGAWNTACLIQTNITQLLYFWVFILLNWAFFILRPTLDEQLPRQCMLRTVFNLHLLTFTWNKDNFKPPEIFHHWALKSSNVWILTMFAKELYTFSHAESEGSKHTACLSASVTTWQL